MSDLEIVAHCSPTVMVFCALCFCFFIYLNTIRTVLVPMLANNMQLALRTISIALKLTIPVFWLGICLFHHQCPCFAIVNCFLMYPSLFASYSLSIMHGDEGMVICVERTLLDFWYLRYIDLVRLLAVLYRLGRVAQNKQDFFDIVCTGLQIGSNAVCWL